MDNAYIPSTWRRLGANWIDNILMLPLYIPFAGAVFRLAMTDDEVLISLGSFFCFLFIPALYELIFLILMQATPGKWFLNLKVVPFHNTAGELTWQQCVLRPLTGRLSLFFGLAPYALAFFRYDRTHGPDWVAETRVVQAVPRVKKAKIRWIVGSILIGYMAVDGMRMASTIIRSVDWQNHRVDLRVWEEVRSGKDLLQEYENEEEAE